MRLENKVVVVTGASAGMGREMALTFAREGAKVLAVARREDVLLELCQEATDCPGSIEAFVGDCSQKDVCEKMITTAVGKYGRLDSLVNNAGIMDDTTAVGDFKDEYLEKIYNLNTFGVLYSMRAAVKQLLTQDCDEEKGRGNILNITSIGAQHACAGVVYCSSKAAVEAVTKHTAFMYQADGIRVNAIAPGGVITDIFFNMPTADEFGSSKTGLYTPAMTRLGNASEVAEAALFLISDEASYVNGQILPVNGGWLCF